MKNQKGFIQIPILIAIILGVLVIGGAGYVGVKQYQSHKTENAPTELSEIQKLRQEVDDLKKQAVVQKSSPKETLLKLPTVAEQKSKNPQQFENLVNNNKIQLREASKILSNKNIIARVKPSVVYIETTSGSGSGIVVGVDGYVLTNAHVVTGKNSATIKFTDGRSLTGIVVGRDENIDLALLKVGATNLSPAFLGDSDSVEQGDPVFTFGYPLGIEGDVAFKDGTLSRRQNIDGTIYLEISAQILPGNSGGPLVNQMGEVIGVNTLAIASDNVGGVLIGETLKYAMPINIAKNIIPELKKGRNVVIPKSSTTTPTPSPTPLPVPAPNQPNLPPSVFTPPTTPKIQPRFTGDPYISYTTFDTGWQYTKPNWHINFGITFADAKYASVNCRADNVSDGTYYTKSLKSGTSLDLRVKENGLLEGKTYYCEFYLNNAGDNAGPLDLLRDNSGNLIFKNLSFSVPKTTTESPVINTSPTPQQNNIPLPEPNKVNIKIERSSVVEFNVYNADKPGVPLAIKTVVLRQTGTLTDSDFEFVSYSVGSNTFSNVPISGNKITLNYTPSTGNRILINPKIKASGLNKTLSFVVESIEVYLNDGDRQGEVVGLNQSSGYIAYPDQFIVIPAGEGNSALVQYCQSKFTSFNPTYAWFNDNACVISN